MILRLQTFLIGLLALLTAVLLAFAPASAHPASGGYDLFEPVAQGQQAAALVKAQSNAALAVVDDLGTRTLLGSAWDPSLTTSVFGSHLTVANVLEGAFDASIGATVQTVAYGGSFGDVFKGSFINSVVALGLADAQTGIGGVFNDEYGNPINGGEGSLGHVLLHGLAGCVAAEAQGADCAAGAAGGIAGAIYSGMQKAPERESYASEEEYQVAYSTWKTNVLDKGEIVTLSAAYILSGGKAENVAIASAVGTSAIANNYLTHAQFNDLQEALVDCGTDGACTDQVISQFTEISSEQQHELAMCGTDIDCMAPHLQAIAEARNHPLRVAMLASRGMRSSLLQEFEYQVEVAYFGQTESFFDTGLFEDIFTPDYSGYFGYPEWASENCAGLGSSACMVGFQDALKAGLVVQGIGSGAQAFTISAGAGLVVGVTPGAALALRQCAASPICWETLSVTGGELALGFTGATTGQTFYAVASTGILAGKLVMQHGDEIVGVIDDLGRVLQPVSQTPDDLGRFLVTTSDGVTGYLDDGSQFIRSDWPELSGSLREAALAADAALAGKGRINFGMGTFNSEQTMAMGEAWVGPGYRVTSNGYFESADGLRQFRPPSYKDALAKTQANFEQRLPGQTKWGANGHVDVTP